MHVFSVSFENFLATQVSCWSRRFISSPFISSSKWPFTQINWGFVCRFQRFRCPNRTSRSVPHRSTVWFHLFGCISPSLSLYRFVLKHIVFTAISKNTVQGIIIGHFTKYFCLVNMLVKIIRLCYFGIFSSTLNALFAVPMRSRCDMVDHGEKTTTTGSGGKGGNGRRHEIECEGEVMHSLEKFLRRDAQREGGEETQHNSEKCPIGVFIFHSTLENEQSKHTHARTYTNNGGGKKKIQDTD